MFAAAAVLGVTGSGSATISYVVDGDTIALRGGTHVRLLQIDTPEVETGECYSRRASKDLLRLLPAGARVGLETDRRLDSVDRYGRLLRYVFHRGVNLNLRLVEQGDATVWFYDRDRGKYAAKLLAAARRAQAAGRGLWGSCRTVWNPYGPATTRPRLAGHRQCSDPSHPTVCTRRLRPTSIRRHRAPALQGRPPRSAPLRRRPRREWLRRLRFEFR
jgi:micrococcal nuclease